MKVHLLGPADPPSLVRFNQAALELCAEADARNARAALRGASDVPEQREAENVAEEAEQDPANVPVDASSDAEDPVATA